MRSLFCAIFGFWNYKIRAPHCTSNYLMGSKNFFDMRSRKFWEFQIAKTLLMCEWWRHVTFFSPIYLTRLVIQRSGTVIYGLSNCSNKSTFEIKSSKDHNSSSQIILSEYLTQSCRNVQVWLFFHFYPKVRHINLL